MEALQAGLSTAAARGLVEAAVLAPSGDNVQPWTFQLDPGAGRIVISVDESRDTSPMNAGQRMSRIAVGAAVENILRTAALNGLRAETEESVCPRSIAIQLTEAAAEPLRIDDAVAARCTNRRIYDGREVPPKTIQGLEEQTATLEGVQTHWITDEARIRRFAAIVRHADALMFGSDIIRRAFLANVRFDRPDDEAVEEGLSLASLEVTGSDRTAFRMLPKLPDWLARLMRVGSTIGKQSEKLVLSASGLCLATAPNDDPQTDFAVGRAMQRAWLAFTEQGLAVQPMMSLLVLQNALLNGSTELRKRLPVSRIRALLDEFAGIDPDVADRRPAFMLRFGFASAPTGRCGRRLPLKTDADSKDRDSCQEVM